MMMMRGINTTNINNDDNIEETEEENPLSVDALSSDNDPIDNSHNNNNFFQQLVHVHRRQMMFNFIIKSLAWNRTWWAQCCSISLAALLTYTLNNTGVQLNVQMTIMIIIAVAGALPSYLSEKHLTTVAIGAFVGGQNLIGATGMENPLAVLPPNISSYFWLLLLALVVGWVWNFAMIPKRILDGCSGRLGTTTFLGANLVQLLCWGPLGVVDWNRYYFGFAHPIHVAEEADSTTLSLTDVWTWAEEAELAIAYVVAVMWLDVVAGATRVYHDQYIQQLQQHPQLIIDNNDSYEHQQQLLPKPLSNVLVPVFWAFFSMLLVNITNYQHSPGIYNGFAVGAYVAMSSLQKLSSVSQFAMAGSVAALWGLTLTPFFVGFPGKAGFTAMLGQVSYSSFIEPIFRKLWYQRQHQQEFQSSLLQAPQPPATTTSTHRQASPPLIPPLLSQEQEQTGTTSPSQARKRTKSTKQVFYTKQQKRQQQRLQAQQRDQQKEQSQQRPQQQQQQQRPGQNETMPLYHRAWSYIGEWQHPLTDDPPSSTSTSTYDLV